ncbi:integrin alpha-9-like [Ptychodera flava]|uniref:integrin alpha-9-like n=1 Tax=Ptychodera flava TaxID=63121 RepID=UPI00396A53BD
MFKSAQLFSVFCLLSQLRLQACFNVDLSNPIVFRGPGLADGYFGYTVMEHVNDQGQWILVGAPRDNSTYEPTVDRPGVMYKCNVQLPRDCEQVKLDDKGNERQSWKRPPYIDNKDDQWLGVSMTRQDTDDGSIAVCGHRWANKYYSSQIFPKGVCYILNHDLEFDSVSKIRPCLGETKIAADENNHGIAWFGWCQAGFSSHFMGSDRLLLLGAVGTVAWSGSVISIEGSTKRIPVRDWYGDQTVKKTTYTGYSMSSGHFYSSETREGVTGAPRAYQHGAVFIFETQNFDVMKELQGEQMGSYFGSAVCAIDLNSDGLSDLLVGAPLYATLVDEGRVYVYINRGESLLQRLPFLLRGSNAPNARFGSAIASIGDVNMDGYRDVAIGAPYEGSGVVYIYHGTATGITSNYVQAIKGETVVPGIQSFGISISGGLDLDGNAYQDIAVGAYLDNTVVVFKTRPVVDVHAFLHISPDKISPNSTQCQFNGEPVNCIWALVCFEYTGTAVPGRIPLETSLELERFKVKIGQTTRVNIVALDAIVGTTLTSNMVLRYGNRRCSRYEIHIKKNINDYLTPIPIDVSYKLITDHNRITVCSEICPVLNANIQTTLHTEVAFVRNCGSDEVCVADLQLNAELILPRGYKFLPLGVLNQIAIRITVKNDGEEAHQARLYINYHKELAFVRAERDNLNSIVQCEPDDSSLSNVTSRLTCSMGNPMQPNSKKMFDIKLDTSQVSGDMDALQFDLTAMTSSNDTEQADNFVSLSLPIHIVADITIAGISVPGQIHFGGTLTDVSKDSLSPECKVVGPRIKHTFDVRNLGPGSIPYNSHVRIKWPWKTLDGDYLFFIKHIEIHGTGVCKAEHIFAQQESHEQCNKTKVSDAVSLSSRQEQNLDCGNVKCEILDCYVGPLGVHSSIFIDVLAVAQQSTLLKFDNIELEVTSSAEVFVEDTSGRFVQPSGHQPDSTQVITQAYGLITKGSRKIQLWVLVLSACIGLLALGILIVVLWKLGFFRRKAKEELEKLLNSKEEDSLSNWTVPCENPTSDDTEVHATVYENNAAVYGDYYNNGETNKHDPYF